MEKFNGKYRIPSARLQGYNYAQSGAYFFTICTKDRNHYFGEIEEGIMQLNKLGEMVETEWMKTIDLRPDMNLEAGAFVVMPNHFHAVIIIGENEYNMPPRRDAMHGVSTPNPTPKTDATIRTDAMHGVSTPKPIPKTDPTPKTDAMHGVSTPNNQFGPQSKNLSSIARGFKSAVTTYARITGNTVFNWQTRFHDHIIRNAQSFETIQHYVATNAMNWAKDKFYTNG